MGQYHILVNYDKMETVHPHMLGLGLKQWEHIGFKGGTLADALYILTMTSPARGGGDLPLTRVSGRWAGDRVMVVGDYTEDSDLDGIENAGLLYATAETDFADISEEVGKALGTVFGFELEGDTWKDRVYHEDRQLV